MTFSSEHRTEILNQLEGEMYDVLIIGGGITGSGIALDAATRGMKIALVEMQDFAAGTSSRSTKLVHGGLRYLKQFKVKMVAEVGKERAIVYENGPHVTTPEWMLLPIHQGGTFGKISTSIGLLVYDFLAGVKSSERRSMLSTEETLEREPLLKRTGLKGGGYYVEYKTDDARLTIEVMKEAVKQGATAINYTKVESFIYENGKVKGVLVIDELTEKRYKIFANKIVNAAGPWVDTLREKDHSKKRKSLQLTKGIHLVIDKNRFPLKQAIYFDTPDGRMIFAIPREGKTYVGTTDTVYKGDISHPKITITDCNYLVDAVNYMFPSLNIKVKDIESSWAGLRPLIHEDGKDPSEISRKEEIWISDSGLITIAGGKLTGYRKMAEVVVDLLVKKFNEKEEIFFCACKTKTLPISGGNFGGSKNFQKFVEEKVEIGTQIGLSREQAQRLVKRYGSNIDTVFSYRKNYMENSEDKELPLYVYLQLHYSIKEEMTTKPIDFFFRRTSTLLFDIHWVNEWKDKIITYMATILKWTVDQKSLYQRELETQLHDSYTIVAEKLNEKIS